MKNTRYSREIPVFHGRTSPETGNIAGYAAIIDALELPVPLPHTLALISKKNGQLSQRARTKEFSALTEKEVTDIENIYREIFLEG